MERNATMRSWTAGVRRPRPDLGEVFIGKGRDAASKSDNREAEAPQASHTKKHDGCHIPPGCLVLDNGPSKAQYDPDQRERAKDAQRTQ